MWLTLIALVVPLGLDTFAIAAALGMSGLTRSDLNDATALPLDADPSGLLVRRRAWRERPAEARAHLAA